MPASKSRFWHLCILLTGSMSGAQVASPGQSKRGGSTNIIYKDDIESEHSEEEEPALPKRASRRLVSSAPPFGPRARRASKHACRPVPFASS